MIDHAAAWRLDVHMVDIKALLPILLLYQLPIKQPQATIMTSQIIWLCLFLFRDIRAVHSCVRYFDDPPTHQCDKSALIKAHLKCKDARNGGIRPHVMTTITNVAVFDGSALSESRTDVIEDGRIAEEDSWTKREPHETIDGTCHTPLAGLVGSDFHPETAEHLK